MEGHDELRRLTVAQPARAVDRVIELAGKSRGEAPDSALLDQLAQAVYAVRGLDSTDGTPTFLDLGRRKLPGTDRRYVVAVLLRLLAANPHAISEQVIRGYLRELFESLPARLITALELTRDTFENRLVELPSVAPTAESTLDPIVQGLNSIAKIRKLQSDLPRALNDPYVATAIKPFLPTGLLEEQLATMANAVDRCADLTGEDAFERVEEARRRITSFEETARAVDSSYSDRYLVEIAVKLSRDLERRFDDSPLSRPALLALADPRKRFPLSVEGTELHLQLEIRNLGEGPARHVRVEFERDGAVEPLDPEHVIPSVGPEGRALIVPALVMEAGEQSTLVYEIEWSNADGERCSAFEELRLVAQDPAVDWDALDKLNPYPGRAITDDRKLAGRDMLLQELTALADGPEVGSTRVSGEKRVGKTSLVRSLQTRLTREPADGLLVAYVDVNKLGIATPDSGAAIARLMRAIASELRSQVPELANATLPELGSEAVGDFADFLDAVRYRIGDRRILVILDEFDELPNEVFERSGVGDPFFRALKAFSSGGDCGFVLVGGERLELVLRRQLDRLNAFREHRVDYIDADQLEDYVELVEGPVNGYLEFERDVIVELHRRTAGHPYYTSLVCRELVSQAVARRDNHVTLVELNDAYRAALRKATASAFAHIWFDHVFADSNELNAIADRRLRVLHAWATCLRRSPSVTDSALVDEARQMGLDPAAAREELRQFVARSLLKNDGGQIEARNRFLQDWLKNWGPEQIRVDPDSQEAMAKLKTVEDERRVDAAEIEDLVTTWPHYQSRRVEPEAIRRWLDQFPDTASERLAFKVLQALRAISNADLRELLERIHSEARRGARIRVESDQRYRREFAVVHVTEDGGASGLMAKQYASANKIHSSCVMPFERLEQNLIEREFQRVVVIEDFVGGGRTAIRRMGRSADVIRLAATTTKRSVILGVACGFEDGLGAVEQAIAKGKLPIEVAVGRRLAASDHCFAEQAQIFDSIEELLAAKQLFEKMARRHGSIDAGDLDRDGLIVFEHNCPAATLPLLWKRGDGWLPLFERIG